MDPVRRIKCVYLISFYWYLLARWYLPQVVAGDYCSQIGSKNGITVAQIEQFNANVCAILFPRRCVDPNILQTYKWKGCGSLQIGMVICLSKGTPPPIPSAFPFMPFFLRLTFFVQSTRTSNVALSLPVVGNAHWTHVAPHMGFAVSHQNSARLRPMGNLGMSMPTRY